MTTITPATKLPKRPRRRARNLPLKSPPGGEIYLIESRSGLWKASVMADVDGTGTARPIFRVQNEYATKDEALDEVALRYETRFPGMALVASVHEVPRYRPRRRR